MQFHIEKGRSCLGVSAEELPRFLITCLLKTSPDGNASPVVVPRPNLQSVRNILKKFFAGFERITGMEISDELRTDIYCGGVDTTP
jgi:hypothetical protein